MNTNNKATAISNHKQLKFWKRDDEGKRHIEVKGCRGKQVWRILQSQDLSKVREAAYLTSFEQIEIIVHLAQRLRGIISIGRNDKKSSLVELWSPKSKKHRASRCKKRAVLRRDFPCRKEPSLGTFHRSLK